MAKDLSYEVKVDERIGGIRPGFWNLWPAHVDWNGDTNSDSIIRQAFGVDLPNSGGLITDDLEKEKAGGIRYRMQNNRCLKCHQKNSKPGNMWEMYYPFTSNAPYCYECFESSKERIVSNWLKRHEHLPEVREMRRNGTDIEEMFQFIRRKTWRNQKVSGK